MTSLFFRAVRHSLRSRERGEEKEFAYAASRTQTRPPEERGLAYKWKVLSIVIFGIFMVILDTTVVNVAFQTLRQEFGSHPRRFAVDHQRLRAGARHHHTAGRLSGRPLRHQADLSERASPSLCSARCWRAGAQHLAADRGACRCRASAAASPCRWASRCCCAPSRSRSRAWRWASLASPPGRAGDRPHPGRLAGGPRPVALDLLHQPADRPGRRRAGARSCCATSPAGASRRSTCWG